MGMLSRLRERGETFVAQRLQGRAVSFSGRLPSPWRTRFEFTLEAAAEPEARGQRLRLRAHSRLSVPGRALRSWLEVRSSTAALDEGSRALVPERLGALGITPAAGKPVQTWAGALEGPRPGFAVLTLVQLDRDRLHLAATLASVVEET
jgi:hypothetical protein